jgi:uncharacterized protein with GYD domain
MDANENGADKRRSPTNRTPAEHIQVRLWGAGGLYFTFGRYDKVVIAEAPSDEAMAALPALTILF